MHEDIFIWTLNFIIISDLSNALFRVISEVITSPAVSCVCVHTHCNLLTQIYSPHKKKIKENANKCIVVVISCAV
jgi:hypothetical protein